ncbi:hypothetical protein LYNGBM3L_62570 [Moorena producens 3L]|uniref:Uncharacterized protein n=1 Tax=Moorena producens 3L TaxID=489825 RepID=F4Y169_9CYAN|nr:hypothetical protein LYNGBM3L_62570 [Moorena producens 3L]
MIVKRNKEKEKGEREEIGVVSFTEATSYQAKGRETRENHQQ